MQEELISNDTEKFKKTFKKAKKEIPKNNFNKLDTINNDEIKLNLTLLSNLPLLFLDTNVRIFLFITLYFFEEESKSTIELTELVLNLYSGKYFSFYNIKNFELYHNFF